MTKFDDPWLVDAMWRATDLTRAYLSQNRAHVERCLADLDTGRMERVLAWLVLDHDELFDRLGEPSMAVREIDAVAALSPWRTSSRRRQLYAESHCGRRDSLPQWGTWRYPTRSTRSQSAPRSWRCRPLAVSAR
ncbi:hypothetical protein [Streptomyces sp. NPDC051364]|uniref:hypothetical protein n=1 Tax=Streptomyces sp. NPDC051364 TaxID=3155799 RepID=UPI00343F489B